MIWVLVGLALGWWSANSGKTQAIRAIDVLVLGPFLLYAGFTVRHSQTERNVLILAGASTVAFNLRNFLREQKQ